MLNSKVVVPVESLLKDLTKNMSDEDKIELLDCLEKTNSNDLSKNNPIIPTRYNWNKKYAWCPICGNKVLNSTYCSSCGQRLKPAKKITISDKINFGR